MPDPRRGQRGAGVPDEESSELRFRQKNTRVADREVAVPRRGQRGVGTTDEERLQCRGGDFSFVDAASRKLSLRKEKPCRGPVARHGRGEIFVATGSAVPALLVPPRQRSAGARKTLHRNHNVDEDVLVRVCICLSNGPACVLRYLF